MSKRTKKAEAQTTHEPTSPVQAEETVATAEPTTMSALDAAARVLGEEGKALGCKELIERMAQKGYWSSPAGKTPAATLYAALLREINVKGEDSRFAKADRGLFALRGRSAEKARKSRANSAKDDRLDATGNVPAQEPRS